MKKIIVMGNALVDRLYQNISDEQLNALSLKRGTMTLITDQQAAQLRERLAGVEQKMATGGSAANTSKAIAHLHGDVGFIGCVGCDEEGEFFDMVLKRAGVHACVLNDSAHATGIATTFISPDGERTFATHLGAAEAINSDFINTEIFEGHDLLYLEGYLVQNHGLVLKILRAADRVGLEIALDMASFNIVAADRDFFRQILADYVDIVFANEQEALAFAFPGCDVHNASEEEVHTAAMMLSRICRVAVVKRGAKGVLCIENGNPTEVPAIDLAQERVVDTTAAGDFFAGGFLYNYACGLDTERCLRKGVQLSTEIIQVVGSHLDEDVWEQLRDDDAKN